MTVVLKILEALIELLDGRLFARLLLLGTDVAAEDRMNDPTYQSNVRHLIERSRQFEEARK
uniref:hypothetical protein n=1 Tax=Bradyrhizobium sp. (strain ORS 278) TaxID=114615 RepID=UPI000A2F6BE5|nr:hypothetical protein [Bradyrhizobium sp. ORS 278]